MKSEDAYLNTGQIYRPDGVEDQDGVFPLYELSGLKPVSPKPELNFKKPPKGREPLIDLSPKKDPFGESKSEPKPNNGWFGLKRPKLSVFKQPVFRWSVALSISFVGLWALANGPALAKRISFLNTKLPDDANVVIGSNDGKKVSGATYVGGPDEFRFQALGIKAPVVYSSATDEKGIQKDLERGIVHYGNTAVPGERGNAVFFGHSSYYVWAPGGYKDVFANNDRAKIGDRIELVYAGKLYRYEITETKVVSPNDLSVLNAQSATPKITVISCTPTGTNWKRLILIARQIDPVPENGGSDSEHLPII